LNGLSIDLKRYRPAHTDSVRGSRREVSSTFAPDFCAEKAEIFQAPRCFKYLDVCATPLIRQLFFNHLGTHEGTLR
jgi:hypothetical protein